MSKNVYNVTMNFGIVLTKYRKRAGLNPTELANKIEVNPSYVMNLEHNRKKPPTFEMCHKIAETLNLSKADRVIFFGTAFFERATPDDKKFFHELNLKIPGKGNDQEGP